MISKLENGRRQPSIDLAKPLDDVLQAGGQLITAARCLEHRSQDTHLLPAQLPPATTPLLGRDGEMIRLGYLHSNAPTPIMVLEGPPGVGKTALAVAWAHQRFGEFTDGALFVACSGHTRSGQAPPSSHNLLHGMLVDLGITNIPSDEAAQSRLLRSALHRRRMVIILDDADSTEQVLPLLPGSASCTVLITSRRRLTGLTIAGHGIQVPVTALCTNTGATLLERLLDLDHADRAVLADLAASCAGLPLALRTAATLVRDHPGTDLATIAEHLRGPRRLQILSTTALQDPRVSLRSAFAASYQRLQPTAAALFRHLGHHELRFITSTDAADLLSVPFDQAELALAQLLAEHLVKASLDGCHIDSLVSTYATEVSRQHSAPAHISIDRVDHSPATHTATCA